MFETKTYEALLESALSRVPPGIDKREGSMVMNGVAPSMAELAQLYIGLDFVFNATYLATAPREYLIRRAADRNMRPRSATAAVFLAAFNMDVPEGTRFSCGAFNFAVTAHVAPSSNEDEVRLRVVCETAGSAPNGLSGTLVPISYVDGLTYAELVEMQIPGEDDEDTEAFRQRVLDSFQTQAFGGNRADYREKVKALPGVMDLKVHPVWNSDLDPAELIPPTGTDTWIGGLSGVPDGIRGWLTAVYTAAAEKKLTVGGTVRLVILAAGGTVPPDGLVEQVQTAVDPTQNAGEGVGLAPIGHVVRVDGVEAVPVDITLRPIYAEGWNWSAVKSHVEAAIDAYFAELTAVWAESAQLVVRIAQIESRILSACADMIIDLSGTTLGGKEANLVLGADSIPVRGAVDG